MKIRITKKAVIPEIDESINNLPKDSDIFVDHALNISKYISLILDNSKVIKNDVDINSQKDLATQLNKNESEISKWLSGTHNLTLRTISKLESALSIEIINPKIKEVVMGNLNNRSFTIPFEAHDSGEDNSTQYGYLTAIIGGIGSYVTQEPDNLHGDFSQQKTKIV